MNTLAAFSWKYLEFKSWDSLQIHLTSYNTKNTIHNPLPNILTSMVLNCTPTHWTPSLLTTCWLVTLFYPLAYTYVKGGLSVALNKCKFFHLIITSKCCIDLVVLWRGLSVALNKCKFFHLIITSKYCIDLVVLWRMFKTSVGSTINSWWFVKVGANVEKE